MSSWEIETSIKRIEEDLYYSADNIKVRLARIEEKLEHVATREDMVKLEGTMRGDMENLRIATREDMEKLRIAMREDMVKLEVSMRDDMEKLEGTMRDDMAEFKSDTRNDMAKLNTKVELLRMDMERQKTDLIAHTNAQFRWTAGLIVSVAGVIVAVLKLT